MSNVSYLLLLGLNLACLAGDIVLTNGFMLLRIPPIGAGVPINEVLLGIDIAAILLTRQPTGSFTDRPVFLPLLLLWIHAGVQLVLGLFVAGIWAIRDAANVIETGFLFVGYWLACDGRFASIFQRWLSQVFCFAAFYIMLYPVQNSLTRFSPGINSMSGYTTPLFFSYGNPASIAVTSVCYLLIGNVGAKYVRLMLSGALVMVLVVFVQARVVYLQLAVLLLLIAFFKPQRLTSLGVMTSAAIGLAAIFLISGIELPGRLGTTFTLDFLTNHVAAIWGGGNSITHDAAEGVDLRLGWWRHIHEDLQRDLRTWFFGLGYGMPLTSFRGVSDDIVREPHNSFISIYGRLGIVGALSFITLQTIIIATTIRVALIAARNQLARVQICTITILCFFLVHLIYAFSEPGLELSFIAVPYYFFAGVVIALHRSLSETEKTSWASERRRRAIGMLPIRRSSNL